MRGNGGEPVPYNPIHVLNIPCGLTGRASLHRMRHAMAHHTVAQHIPHDIHVQPNMRFSSGMPLGRLWLSYKHVATNMTSAELHAAAQSCSCSLLPHDDVHPALQHVCSTDPTNLPENLRFFWTHGSRFRVRPDEHLEIIFSQLRHNIDEYCGRIETYEQLHPGTMRPWGDALFTKWHSLLIQESSAWQFPDDITYTVADNRAHHRLTQDYVITVMDKNASNFVLVCKRYYTQTVLNDLADPQVYNSASQQEYSDSLRRLDLAAGPWNIPTPTHLKPAYYAGTLKFHKQPPKMRFLACSSNTPSTPICRFTTSVLTAVYAGFCDMWAEKCNVTPYVHPFSNPWIIPNSKSIMPTIRAFNTRNRAWDSTAYPESYDFERLYTNLPHDDLTAVLRDLFKRVLQHKGATALKIDVSIGPQPKLKSHTWVNHVPAVLHRTHKFGTTYWITEGRFNYLFNIIISDCFIMFGSDALYRQTKGIPMGISPAPLIANLFLGYYEYKFMLRLTNFTCCALRRSFCDTHRFIDDLLTIDNPYFPQLTYNDQSLRHTMPNGTTHTFHGIYPRTLGLSLSHPPGAAVVPYMDVHLQIAQEQGNARIITSLYDKRDGREFRMANININRYVHATSCVDPRCLKNILASQFWRFIGLINQPRALVNAIARCMATLVQQGHHPHTIWRNGTRLLAQYRPLMPRWCAKLYHDSLEQHYTAWTTHMRTQPQPQPHTAPHDTVQ